MGTQKYIMKMLKELLVSSPDMLGLFNLPMVNQLETKQTSGILVNKCNEVYF